MEVAIKLVSVCCKLDNIGFQCVMVFDVLI